MKYSLLIFLIFISKILFSQSEVDVYKYFGGYFEYTLSVNWIDSSFSYSKVGDMVYERSFGSFIKKNDTLILNSSDTAFYSYDLEYDPRVGDSIKLISSASESLAPFLSRVNDSLVYLTDDLKIENDSVFSFGIIRRTEFNEPIMLKIDANQRNPILIPNDKNVILFKSWFGPWRFHEFSNDKWIIIDDSKMTSSITEYWKEIFDNDSKRKNYFEKKNN